jgi:peroxiredoxin
VRGSKGSQLVRELNNKLNGVVKNIDSLSYHFRSNRDNPKFDSIKLAIDTAYNELIQNHKNYTVDFIKSNRYSLASILALYQQYNKTTPVLNSRDDFELFKLVDSVLYPLYPNNSLVANLHSNVKKISAQLKIYDKRENMLIEGQRVPNIELPLFGADTIMLYNVRSRYILVDFWATWCNECVPNNKKLKEIYNVYSTKGFQVVQVSLDDNRSELDRIVKSDSIPWLMVADFKQWNSPIIDTMSVNSIPSNYLINSQGIIQARNLTLNELEIVLKSLLP